MPERRADAAADVVRCEAVPRPRIDRLAVRAGLVSSPRARGASLPGSYWGEPEAGLLGRRLYWRADTPVHSLLHELAHFVCMDGGRRARLDTDAGSDDAEECAVCYLEVALAPLLAPYGRDRCLTDMDLWGYSFREGSARAWLAGDGREAAGWLRRHGLIDGAGEPTFRLRGRPIRGG